MSVTAGGLARLIILQLEKSLQKLRTTYIDLLYIHWSVVQMACLAVLTSRWDYSTSIPEIMQSLNDVVKSGKVLYLGISDTPGESLPRLLDIILTTKLGSYHKRMNMLVRTVWPNSWSSMSRQVEVGVRN